MASGFTNFRYEFRKKPFVETMKISGTETATVMLKFFSRIIRCRKVGSVGDTVVQIEDLVQNDIVGEIKFIRTRPEEFVSLSEPVIRSEWFVEGQLRRCREITTIEIVVEGILK
jgi:hypothetical protein